MRITIGMILSILVLASAAPATAAQTPTDPPACLDFGSQQEAQAFFENEGGPSQDPLGLDPNRDGRACDDETAIVAETPTMTATSPTTTASSSGFRTGVLVAIAVFATAVGLSLYYLWRRRSAPTPSSSAP